MKHSVLFVLTALLALPLGMRAQVYMQTKSLNMIPWGTANLYVHQDGTEDAFSFGSTAGVGYEASNDVGNFWRIFIPQTEEEQRLADYTAPTYADDYRSLNDWSDRNEWELANVHDPTVMKAADGYYYMYQTDASYGNVHYASGGHYIGRRSKDLVHWEYVGTCMPKVPAWIRDSLNVYRKAMGLTASTVNWDDEAQFGWWAPCARKVNDNLYRMYYVVTLPGTITPNTAVGNPCFIGLMESTNPADSASWVDKGYVTTQYSDQGTDYEDKSAWGGYYRYNAIDPSYIITPEGEHWLIYGSWHSGFPAMQLDPSTGKSLKPHHLPWDAGNADAYGKRIFTRYRNNRWQASEAPEVVYHDGYYYLFVAFDELSKCYNTRVLRSETIDGQYVDITDRSFTNGATNGDVYPVVTHPYKFGSNHGWVGISHCAVFDDGEGNWFYASQQRFPQNYNGDAYANAIMMGGVRRVLWTPSGWPVVLPERYGNVPQTPITEEDIVGGWQHINLEYIQGSDNDDSDHMDRSVDVTFNADHTISGAPFDGASWKLDSERNILTLSLSDGDVDLCLAREADWESNPRHATIVYAGYNTNETVPVTYWGKRVSSPSYADDAE